MPTAIFLMGPTASGKTGLALHLVEKMACEVVSVDSALIYRGMDIGTAKPGMDILRRVPHHLVDIVDPTQSYSAAQFCSDALQCMRQITARGRIPLLTGGTMLYFKALREGLSELPAADAALRARLEEKARYEGWSRLHAELQCVDPPTAARLRPNDGQRIQRALEIFYLTGRPMSAHLAPGRKAALPYRLIPVALLPGRREELHRRIASRFDAMLARGLIDEVRALRGRFPLTAAMPAMRCVGYRQVWQYLEQKCDLATLRERAIVATRQLAKRQLTWLRAMQGIEGFDCLEVDVGAKVLRFVDRRLTERAPGLRQDRNA
jgi:tRNA dimethylallyltransferase